jgi:hypothetical protein
MSIAPFAIKIVALAVIFAPAAVALGALILDQPEGRDRADQ